MHFMTIPAVLAVFMQALPAAAAACPFPMVQECTPLRKDRPPATQRPACRCVNPPGPPSHQGPKVNKKNVPTVKPNTSSGVNG